MGPHEAQTLRIRGGKQVCSAVAQPLFRTAIVTAELESPAAAADVEIQRFAPLRFEPTSGRACPRLEDGFVGGLESVGDVVDSRFAVGLKQKE